MFDPTIDIIMFLTGAFILGLALGWVIWKLSVEERAAAEVEFWKNRWNQVQQERGLDQQKIADLEKDAQAS